MGQMLSGASAARERPSDEVNDNRHRQRWTSVDTSGRSAAGHACCAAGSQRRNLASGRKAACPDRSTATAANTAAKPLDNTSPEWTAVECRPSARTAVDGSGRCAYSYGSGGQKHAGGSVGDLPRTRRRSVHDSRNLSRAPLASLRDRLRRPLTEPICRQVRQLSGSGEGPGTGQGAARLPETGREMARRTRASRRRQPGITLSHGKPPRGSGRARPWRRPGGSQDRHQYSSKQQAVTGGSARTR
jgi:hypothetical protein